VSAVNKIKKWALEERTIALAVGHTHQEIAEILTNDLDGKDTISQPTVSRFLKDVYEQRKSALGPIIKNYVETKLGSDLEILDELKRDNLNVYRGLVTGVVTPEGGIKYGFKERMASHDRLHELIKTTLRFVGVPGDGGIPGSADPVDLEQFRTDEKVKKGNG